MIGAETAGTATDSEAETPEVRRRRSPVRLALMVGVVIVSACLGAVGWLSHQVVVSHRADRQRSVFLEVGRQAALNLTTIDHTHVDADVARILASATGAFYDSFQKRKQPFIDLVKQLQSTSVGTVTGAGVESIGGGGAQVAVALQVTTTTAGAPQEEQKGWRMRIDLQSIGGEVKVSNVAFVP